MDVCGIDATLNDIYLAESPGTTTIQLGGNCTDGTVLHIPDQAETIVVIFFFTLIGIMGIVFNIISILVVMRGKHTAKAIKGTKIQLVNQSAGDLTMALICTPRTIVRDLAFSWPDSEALCRLVPFFGQSAFESSVAWSVAISIERFVAVFFPFRIRFYRGRHKIIVAVALWTLMAISNIEYLIYKTPKVINTYSNSSISPKSLRLCVNTVPLAQTNKPLYDVLEGLPYLIFSVIIILMYSSIGVKLWMRKRNKILRSDNKANRVEKVSPYSPVSLIHRGPLYVTNNIPTMQLQLRFPRSIRFPCNSKFLFSWIRIDYNQNCDQFAHTGVPSSQARGEFSTSRTEGT